jgi:hypothetical protein
MQRVLRDEILDYVTYEEQRNEIRKNVLEIKNKRRIHLGDNLTFLFENRETIRYQVLEMVRTERMVKEKDIQHELDTYNEIMGSQGDLGCTLLIEIDSEEQRNILLRKWRDLPKHIYLVLADGSKTYAEYDKRQMNEEKVSSVQFLKFKCEGKEVVEIASDFEYYNERLELSSEQKKALAEDLM